MHINMNNVLFLERRGCEFNENEIISAISNIGNHRLTTTGYTFQCANGRAYHVEIMHADKYVWRYTNMRTGAKLRKPIRERKAVCVAHFRFSYEDERGCWADLDLEQAAWAAEVPFNESDILSYLNTLAAVAYDDIKYVYTFNFTERKTADFTPAAKIYEWAKKNHLEAWNTLDGIRVRTVTGDYKYCCYEIEPADEENERVNIYLERAEAGKPARMPA